MPSAVHKRGPTTPEMNLTPLIDVVFQLIIFFMLVNNIVSNEIVPMKVPDLEDPRTQAMAEENRIIVSIEPLAPPEERGDQPLAAPGEANRIKVGTTWYELTDLEAVAAQLRQARADNEEIEVLLRADAVLFYDEVQPVMTAITQAGIGTVNLVALMPQDQRSGTRAAGQPAAVNQ